MKYISYAISFLVLCVISFGVTSAYDQVFPKVKLRYGYSYKFSDTLINDTSYEIKLRKLITTFKDNGDFNGGANPSFPYTQAIRNDNTLNPGQKRQITLSSPWYKVKYHPVKRGGKDIEIIYKTIQQSKKGGTWGPQLTHTEYQPYMITWCGDGVVDNYKDPSGKQIKETCDPGDTKNKKGWGNGGCSNTCKPITKPTPPSCTKIDVKPTSGKAPVTSNMSCTGKNAKSYKIVVKNGSKVIKTFNSKTATYKFSNSGKYTAQCYVNNTITSKACKKDVTVVGTSTPKIYDLALTKKVLGKKSGYKVGDKVSFSIRVYNQGNVTAKKFTITDYIPAGLELVATNGWTQSGNKAFKTVNTTLAKNGSYDVNITFKILDSAPKTIKNYAEISKDDGNDCDSTPDDTNGNGSGESSGLIDDDIGNGCNSGGDEDDHDIAEITMEDPIYDLALRKTLSSKTTSPFKVGDIVTFDIRVFNQGTVDADKITVTDYIPAGLELVATNAWTQSGNKAKRDVYDVFVGKSKRIEISFKILDSAPKTIKNYAEISEDDGDDCDSTPDDTNGNGDGESSGLIDDDIGNGCNSGGDEDDHDIAEITISDNVYDLALRKTLSTSTPGPFKQGDKVTFNIEVINQGTIDANNIEITDYIPTGLELQDAAWTQSGSTAIMTISQVATDAPVVKTITFKILDTAPKTIKNYAEISEDDGDDCDSTPDDTNGNGSGESSGLIDDDIGNGCNSGGDEDDHDIEEITIGTDVVACTSLTASPSSARNSLTSTLSCTGTNVNSYKIEVKNANGSVVKTLNTNSGQITLNSTGKYTASCYINGENETPNVCTKTLSVTTGGGGGSTYRCNDAVRTVGNTVRCYGNGKVNSFALTCGNDADGNPIRKGPQKYTKDSNGRKYAEFDCGSTEAQCYVYDKTVTNLNWGSYAWRGGNQCKPDVNPNCGNGVVDTGEECDTTQVVDKDGKPVYNADGTPKLNPFPTSVCYAPGTTKACKLRKNGGGGGKPNCDKNGNCILTWPGNGDTRFGPQKDIIIGHNQNVYDVAGAYPYIYNNSKNDISFKKMCIKEVKNDNAIETNHQNKEICVNIGNQMIYAYESLFMIEEKVGGTWIPKVITQYRKDELMGSDNIRPPRFIGDKNGIGDRPYGEGRMVTTVSNNTGGDHYKFYFAGKTNVRVAKPAISTVGGGTSYVKSSDSGDVSKVTDGKSNNFVGTSASADSEEVISSDVEEVKNSQTEVIDNIEKEKESITDSHEIIDFSPVSNTNFERYNGLDNVYVKTGNYTLDNIGDVQGMDLKNLTKPTTFIIQDGNLIISQNVKSNKNIAFVVRGGDIVIDKDVTKMDGTYIAIPKNEKGGAFISEESEKQLLVNGSLYGDIAKLIDNRYYISNDTQGLGVGTIVAFGSGLFSKTAPLVTEFTNEYLSSQKVAK